MDHARETQRQLNDSTLRTYIVTVNGGTPIETHGHTHAPYGSNGACILTFDDAGRTLITDVFVGETVHIHDATPEAQKERAKAAIRLVKAAGSRRGEVH